MSCIEIGALLRLLPADVDGTDRASKQLSRPAFYIFLQSFAMA
jgi:hypothetical protein